MNYQICLQCTRVAKDTNYIEAAYDVVKIVVESVFRIRLACMLVPCTLSDLALANMKTTQPFAGQTLTTSIA